MNCVTKADNSTRSDNQMNRYPLHLAKSTHTQALTTISLWIALPGHLQVTLDIHCKMHPDFRKKNMCLRIQEMWFERVYQHIQKTTEKKRTKMVTEIVHILAYLHSLNI